MTAAYQINDSYGVVLADSGRVLPYGPLGKPIDPEDSAAILQLALAAAVEISILRGGAQPETLDEIFSPDFNATGDYSLPQTNSSESDELP